MLQLRGRIQRHRAVCILLEHDGGVGVVVHIPRPFAGERVEIYALKQAGIVGKITVLVVDRNGVFHARLLRNAGAEHVAVHLGGNGNRTRRRVIIRIEVHQIKYGVFADPGAMVSVLPSNQQAAASKAYQSRRAYSSLSPSRK